jgi:hypothetical protein
MESKSWIFREGDLPRLIQCLKTAVWGFVATVIGFFLVVYGPGMYDLMFNK